MAVVIRVHRREGGLEAVRHEQILQVLIAAVDEEIYHFLIRPHGAHLCVNESVSLTATIKPCTGAHDFVLLERARVVLVDHLEASASRVEELGAEFGIVAEGRPLAALALDGELLQALRQALVDGRLPARVRSYASTRRRRVDGGDCDVRRTA